jgi:hypothetical protein
MLSGLASDATLRRCQGSPDLRLVIELDFGPTPSSITAHTRVDRLPQMQTETVADAITAVTPIPEEARPHDARMQLTGTLRQRGAGYLLEQQLDADTGNGPQWTTPRIHRVMATDETRAAVLANIDRLVTIDGTPGCGDERNRTSIVLDSIRPLERVPSQG